MALEIKLNQKLSQSLIMTPQLQQAIKLLQLGRVEYLEVIEKELLENPVLEDQRESESFEQPKADEPRKDAAAPPEPAKPRTSEEGEYVNYIDLYADSYSSSYRPSRRTDFDDDRPSLEASVTKPEGLFSHLLWQIQTSELCPEDREIAIQIVGNLDRDGYLIATVEELAQDCRCAPPDIERVLSAVQAMDPPGIAARDLRECLLIQLDQNNMGAGLAQVLVDKHLAKLELRRYDQIAREEGVGLEEIYEALRQIQKLEPRPGRPFVDEAPVYITPDIFVRKIEDEWVISLNDAGLPKLRLNPRYREYLSEARGDKEYLQERIRSASWLIKSIQQRQQTIYRVAESIMKHQRDFLEQGISALRPLVLRDVAEDVKMHESTVSRVTTNKYIHTPHGVLELKFFFSSGLRTEEGAVSSESVKERIREVIAAEDPAHPLSDQAIVQQLKAEGIDIARRTVAKYREMMNVLSSARRKRVF